MSKTVYLRLGLGNLQQGFADVEVRLLDASRLIAQKRGALPPEPELATVLATWQFLHEAFYEQRRFRSRGAIVEGIELETSGVTSFSVGHFQQVTNRLQATMRNWLNAASMMEINNLLRTKLDEQDEIQVMIETEDDCLHRLPWHFWGWLRDFRNAEPVFNAPEFIQRPQQHQRSQCRILVVLGDRTGINTTDDERLLHKLAAEVVLLSEPSRKQLSDRLRDPIGWDIFFFAGHSSSREGGHLRLNAIESVSIADLRLVLGRAIDTGLQLAIFNSCDGAALARDLAGLNIPTIVVMKESVPNQVAQEFLKALLDTFTYGRSLPRAVREARESLESLEPEFPCASWLPAIWHNPTVEPLMWHQLNPVPAQIDSPKRFVRKRKSWKAAIALTLVITCVVMGVRMQGWLQPYELQAFDALMRLRPVEGADQRLLIVVFTQTDINDQLRGQEPGQGSLSDRTLQRVLSVLDLYKPRAIGLDLLRDRPVTSKYQASLGRRLRDRQAPPVIAICAFKAQYEQGVAKPPEISDAQISFNDVPQDADQITRLFVMTGRKRDSPCTARVSLGLKLALSYLEKIGIKSERTPENFLKLNSVIFPRLDKYAGGYQNNPDVDKRFDQILLNYRPYRNLAQIAETVALGDVLHDRVHPDLIRNRIILIGRIDTDLWQTPYPAWEVFQGGTPGVYIHAQAVSQILSAVLDGRSLLWWWPLWADGLWIATWASIGTVITFWIGRRRTVWRLLGAVGVAFLVVYLCCWVGILLTGWLPLVPAWLALGMASVSGSAYLRWKRLRDRNPH